MFKIDEDLAEDVGIHIGDGSMNFYSGIGCYTVACHWIDDKEYIDSYVSKLIEKIYGIKPKLRIWSKGTYGFIIYSKDVVNFKSQVLNLPLGPKKNIKIPEIICKDERLLKSCLRGLIDTDGCLYLEKKYGKLYPRIIFTNTSKPLVFQVKNCLEKFGFTVSLQVRNHDNKNWNITYILCTRGFNNLKLWMRLVGFSNPKNIMKINLLKERKYF